MSVFLVNNQRDALFHVFIYLFHLYTWLRRCAASRTVPGSIPGGVTGDSFRGSFRQNHVP